MDVDRLQGLLQHFTVNAHAFHSGRLCGIHDFQGNGLGQMHLVRRGPVEVRHAGAHFIVDAPSLLLYPQPMTHRFLTDPDTGADMACAHLSFGPGERHPIPRALPAFVRLPLAELHGARPVLELLFDEAFAARCGRQAVVDRLFEVVLVMVLRHLLDGGLVRSGPLAGLAHPQLALALAAMHDTPARAWTLDRLARTAGMSRSRFAQVFAQVVGQPPAAYLAAFRITLAQEALQRGGKLERIAQDVGYGSAAALSRAFTATCGVSPRHWRASRGGMQEQAPP